MRLLGLPKKIFKTKKRIAIFVIIILILALPIRSILFPKPTYTNSAKVSRGDLKQELTVSGKIDSEDHAVLHFQTAGKLIYLGVKEGDKVVKGQMIASLDKQNLEAALRQAQQDFTAAKAQSDKYYDGRTGDSESYDQRITRTALDATQNKAYDAMRIAQENIVNATLYSPINGVVTNLDVSETGVNILTTQGFEIVNPDTIYLSVTADQTDVVNLKTNESGKIVFDAYPDNEIPGSIKSIAFTPKTDDTGTTYEVKVMFANADMNKYKLGMTADVTFVTSEKQNVLYVPMDYVKTDIKGKYVLEDNGKKKVYVKTGLETDSGIQITDGVSEGDTVYD